MATKVISFGPKEFVQGFSPLQGTQGVGGFFGDLDIINPYNFPGFICPGPLATAYTGPTITEQPYSVQYVDTFFHNGFLLTAGKLYQIKDGATITSSGVWPHTLSSGTVSYSHSVLQYAIGSGAGNVFYFTDIDIGMWDHSAFTDNWGSTIPTGAGVLSSGVPHRGVVFNKILYFTNENYIGTLDLSAGLPGVLNRTKFLLPGEGYIAKDIAVVNGLLEIYVDNTEEVALISWDGVSTLAQDIRKMDDTFMHASELVEGFPMMVTSGRSAGYTIRRKNYYGYPQVQTLMNSQNALNSQYLINPATVASANAQLFVAFTNSPRAFTFGTPYGQYSYRGGDNSGMFPDALNQPFRTTGANILCLTPFPGGITVASKTNTTYYLEHFQFARYTNYNNADASFQTNFTQLPDDSTIEWIKFYILPTAAGAKFTPKLYTDYGSSPLTFSEDLSASTLDANGNSKTYYNIGAICDNFAIGGNWLNSTDPTQTIVITRIDVGYASK